MRSRVPQGYSRRSARCDKKGSACMDTSIQCMQHRTRGRQLRIEPVALISFGGSLKLAKRKDFFLCRYQSVFLHSEMPCGCASTAKNEAKMGRKKKRTRKTKTKRKRTGPLVTVEIGGRRFKAHKKQGTAAGRQKLKAKNPKLYARSQAAKQVAAEMRQEGRPAKGIMDPVFKRRVEKRYHELL